MDEKEAGLLKAAHKALGNHFKKAAKQHEEMAECHKNMSECHKAHAEHYEKCMTRKAAEAEGDNDADDAKKCAAFHKTMCGYHEKCHKSHVAHADHCQKMAEACEQDDAEKVLKLAGVEMDPITPTPTPAAAAAPTSTPAAAPAASAPASEPGEGSVVKAMERQLEDKLTKAIEAGIDRVMSSDSFSKALDEKLTAAMLAKLGGTVPTPVASIPVPRAASASPMVVKATEGGGISVSTAGLSPELEDLIKTD